MCLAPEGFPEATVWEIIKQSPDHTILESAVINAGLVIKLHEEHKKEFISAFIFLIGPWIHYGIINWCMYYIFYYVFRLIFTYIFFTIYFKIIAMIFLTAWIIYVKREAPERD